MKYYLGIDQSFTNTGISIIDEKDDIIETTSIPTSPDILKMYELYPEHVEEYLHPLVGVILDTDFKLNKKRKDLTKKDKDMLKIDITVRLNIICDELEKVLDRYHCNSHRNTFSNNSLRRELISGGVETISFGSKGNTADLGSLLGAIQRTLHVNKVELHKFEPKRVKKFAGNGSYSKEEMFDSLAEHERDILVGNCPINTRGTVVGLDDRVDALWIAKMSKECSLNSK